MSMFDVRGYFTIEEKADASKWEPFSATQAGQISILDAAKVGDRSAINFIFIRSSATIYSAFKHFVGPNSYYRNKRIAEGDYNEFLSYAYQILLDPAMKGGYIEGDAEELEFRGSSPLALFDPNVFGRNDNLLDRFNWLYLHTLYQTGDWANRNKSKCGFTGIDSVEATQEKVHLMHDIHDERTSEQYAVADVVFNEVVKSDSILFSKWESFCGDRRLYRSSSVSIACILKESLARGKDFSINKFADDVGISKSVIYKALSRVQPILLEYDIDKEDFCNLIQKYGGETLAEYL